MMSEEIQRINLNDYIQTGEGGTALTYTRKDGLSLAKLYKPGFEADRAKAEFLTARTVFELGIPSPERLEEISLKFARIARELHAKEADSQSPLHVRHDFQRPHARRSLAKNRQIVLAD